MKKYTISPEEKNGITLSIFEKQNNTIETTVKKQAINYAKKLSKTYNSVSFNSDTYIKNKCINNIFGIFQNNIITIYSTIDYKEKKNKKQTLKIDVSMFFGDDVILKIK